MSMLKVENLSVHYGMIQAVRDVSLKSMKGKLFLLSVLMVLGKHLFFSTLSGLVRPSAGKIEFWVKRFKSSGTKIVAAGLSQVPEGRQVFPRFDRYGKLGNGSFLKKNREENQANLKKSLHVSHVWKNGRTKMQQPYLVGNNKCLQWVVPSCRRLKLLLLDEPSMGLAPIFIQEILISSKIFKNKEQPFS